jgi:SAM-dependent methyltransferase
MDLSENYWDNRYKTNDIGWDIGHVSTPLKTYIDQLTNKNLKILIPGGGNSLEAEYLYNNGFKNVHVVELSKTVLYNFKQRVPIFPQSQLLHLDFFDLEMTFDLIIEQTFFCALAPSLRKKYALKMSQVLNKGGKLTGLLFNTPLNTDRPPFGGNKKEYLDYFTPYFNIDILESCYNSIDSRKNQELFIKLSLK